MASIKTKSISLQSDIQEMHCHLLDKANELIPKWGSYCGVHDRPPGQRDTRDRAQLRAEIYAYVAYLFGVLRDDFAYILNILPKLKKKEKAFDEFISKCKYLEGSDRIKSMLAAGGGHS